VHLTREEEKVVHSFNQRWSDTKTSIVFAFAQTIKFLTPETLDEINKYEISREYVRITKDNIEFFFKDKTNTMEISLENFSNDFREFWKWINAEGNLDLALSELGKTHNASTNVENEVKEKLEAKSSQKLPFLKRLRHKLRIN